MATVTRSRRASIERETTQIRMRCQRHGHSIERTVTASNALPEVSSLEAWRLGLGWSRVKTVTQIGQLCTALQLGLSQAGPARTHPDVAASHRRTRRSGQRLIGLGAPPRPIRTALDR
ncbi:hypothetical protein WKI65_43765 [Streptomyces sp. MS1.AVA.3]|uniref:hypothetical protein n=1 Tax=Streptomyces decoyicus TaxID=249567 RepID=UPI0030BC4D49